MSATQAWPGPGGAGGDLESAVLRVGPAARRGGRTRDRPAGGRQVRTGQPECPAGARVVETFGAENAGLPRMTMGLGIHWPKVARRVRR